MYEQIKKRSLPLITDYHNDLLIHDKKALGENPGVPFIHFTRMYGTHLFFMRPADHEAWPKGGEMVKYIFGHASREHILQDTARCIAHAANDDICKLCLYFDGVNLREIKPEDAKKIADEWLYRVERAWHK